MKIGDIVSTPDGLGEITSIEQRGEFASIYWILFDSDRPTGPIRYYYYRNELKLVYSPK